MTMRQQWGLQFREGLKQRNCFPRVDVAWRVAVDCITGGCQLYLLYVCVFGSFAALSCTLWAGMGMIWKAELPRHMFAESNVWV